MRYAVKEFFSYESFHARKKKNQVSTSYLQEEYEIRRQVFFVLWVAQIEKAKDFFADKLHTRASTGKPRKPLSPPGLVYRHKKGTWESQEKEKKRKRPRKARRWLQQRQGSMCPTPSIPFFGSQVFGLRSGPSQLKYRLLHIFSMRKPCAKKVPERDYFTQVEDPAVNPCSEEGPHYCPGV